MNLAWIFWFLCRYNKRLTTINGNAWSRGTNLRLPFAVDASPNLSGDVMSDDSNGNGNVKKAIDNSFARAFLYISWPSLREYDVKMLNFTFYWVRKQATRNFSFSFLTCIRLLGIQLQESSPKFYKVNELELSLSRLKEREFTF